MWHCLPGTIHSACINGTFQEPESSQTCLNNFLHFLLLFIVVYFQSSKVWWWWKILHTTLLSLQNEKDTHAFHKHALDSNSGSFACSHILREDNRLHPELLIGSWLLDLCFVTLNTIYKTVSDSLHHVQIILNHTYFIGVKFLLVQQSSHTPIWYLKWHIVMLSRSAGKSVHCLSDLLNVIWCCSCTLVWNMIFILHSATKCQFLTHCNIMLWEGAV